MVGTLRKLVLTLVYMQTPSLYQLCNVKKGCPVIKHDQRVRQPRPIPIWCPAPAMSGLFYTVAIGRRQALPALPMTRSRLGPPLHFQKPRQTLMIRHIVT